MRTARLICLALLLSLHAVSQPAVPIPDSLKRDAVMVVRQDQEQIEIVSPRKARLYRHYVYTILNSRGDIYGSVHTFYDKFHDLVSATATLYDADGRVLRKIKKGDMQDWNAEGAGILMSDTRIKYYPFSCRSYPYSIEYEEVVETNGLFMLPEWQPQPARNVSVESASLTVGAPVNYPLRYKAYRCPDKPDISEEKSTRTIYWSIRGRCVLPEELYEPAWFDQAARIRLTPADFELEGYKGHLNSWEDLGKFAGSLYVGRDRLPDEARKQVHQLVDGLGDERRKIAVLYRWLQQNTHYVGVELGIGGWQPFDASYVYTKRYGDCKALANYMVALLKEAGIRGATVLIRAGVAPPMDTSFVCPQFNHAIAVAFTGQDSIWLECTSPILPAGYLSSATSDKDALLLSPSGGQVVHTPVYGVHENRFLRHVKGTLSADGNLEAQLIYDYSGLEQDALRSYIGQTAKREQMSLRQQSLGIPNGLIKDLSYIADSAAIPSIRETISLSAEHFAVTAGSRLLISPGYFFKRINGLTEMPSRAHDIQLSASYEEFDSLELTIPEGYTPEGNAFTATYSCPCGSYRIRSTFDEKDRTFRIVCWFTEHKGLYPAADWPRLVRFFNLVHREGIRQLALVKQ
ncbi:MAG: DUF3857 and transglutaminase domain-containing protein [Bacteroidetes bacterium]|nr:DUF3857 and transglutaminase domain-containing protein [Bacteroidota bacterium]